MTLQQLDEVLKVWKGRLASIAENLLELQSDATFQSLTGTGGLATAPITGETATRIRPAVGAMNAMFEQFGLLQTTIDQAEALRRGLPAFFGGEAKARQIEQLLFGRSIQVSMREIPLEQRTLLGGFERAERVSPEELLEPMTRTFAAARDAVLAVDGAWTRFGKSSDRVEAEVARLRAQRALPTALLAASLDAVEARLEAVRAHVQTDPLGAEGELQAQVEPALAEVAQRVQAALHLQQQTRAARVRLEDFLRLHAEAEGSCATAEAKAGAATAPTSVADSKVQGLREWLDRLERKGEEGAVQAVQVGLRHWNAALDACVLQDRAATETARAQGEQRRELRGRLDALKAKARHFGVAESTEMRALVGRAEDLLQHPPTNLQDVAATVARYEERLRGVGRGA